VTDAGRLSAALADRYRIERELGAGGMATVYLAHDVRHDRKVALKVLRPELSAILGAERFLAEIKTTANLQHPHILSLFDSGSAEGLVYYVMPYVEGESLRDRLSREKQLPVEDAVRIAREVADALEYAHRHGVVHRDIKPENVLLHGGHAMVADFGIALAASRSEGGMRMTETGMSLGTPHYMSPEQAMGEREITPRADIYALGCVLYEMLTGEPPFTGPTAQAILARVMTEEPRSLTLQRRSIPPHVEAVVRRALEKLPADRFATAAELAAALDNPAFGATATRARGAATPRTIALPVRQLLPWGLLAAALAFIAWEQLRPAPRPAPPPVYRMTLQTPANAAWADQNGATMALSPDGTVLAYHGRDSLGGRLYLRALDRLDPLPVSGSEASRHPAFSPDGRWVGFVAGSKIMRALAAGGPAETVCEVPAAMTSSGLTWLDSSRIVLAPPDGLKVCAAGGAVQVLLAEPSGTRIVWPHALPGGRAVLYAVQVGGTFQLGVFDLRSKQSKMLGIVGTNPSFVAAGYLVYGNLDGLIRAVPFDTARLAPTGEPLVVAEDVTVGSGGAAKMALSLNGTMVAANGEAGRATLEVVDRHGVSERLPVPEQPYAYPRFSPDGRRVAVAVRTRSTDIWLFDRRQQTLGRLSFDSVSTRPTWTLDGRRVVYVSQAGNQVNLRIVTADGSAPSELLLADSLYQLFAVAFVPGSRSMVVRTTGGAGLRDLWRSSLDSPRTLVPLLTTPAQEVTPTLSPDGRWIAYVSDESGRNEVYVRSFPDMGARYQVSLTGGTEPVWSPRGGEIFYLDGSALLAAAVRTTPGFEVAGRSTLFQATQYNASGFDRLYDVAPDGQHFVFVRHLSLSDLVLTLNWFDNLRARRSGSAAGGERR
jgi:serine/threonine-protein kinase